MICDIYTKAIIIIFHQLDTVASDCNFYSVK